MTQRPPMAHRLWNFCDKGTAVKSERAEGLSLRDPQWSSSSSVALLPLKRPPGLTLFSSAARARLQQHLRSGLKYQTIISDWPRCAVLMLGDKAHGKSVCWALHSQSLSIENKSRNNRNSINTFRVNVAENKSRHP